MATQVFRIGYPETMYIYSARPKNELTGMFYGFSVANNVFWHNI
jgi:hypothetical protein